jgi:hypothetical protein
MRHRLLPALVLVAAACSASTQSSSPAPAPSGAASAQAAAPRAPRSSQNLITSEEVAKSAASNAYDVVQKLRPQWLRVKSMSVSSIASGGSDAPSVFLNDVRYGDITSLRSIDITSLRQLQFLTAAEATTRWGTGYPAGAILVTAAK